MADRCRGICVRFAIPNTDKGNLKRGTVGAFKKLKRFADQRSTRKCTSCEVIFTEEIGYRCPCCHLPLATYCKTNMTNRKKRLELFVRY